MCSVWSLAIFALSLASLASAGTELRTLVASRAAQPPSIDGKLDDPCWAAAERADGFSIYSTVGALHPEQTVGRVCFDDDNLYFAGECAVGDPARFLKALAEGAGRFVYDRFGGTVELFLDPEGCGQSFEQFLLHANGLSQISDASADVLKVLSQDFMTLRTVATDKGFDVELAVPLAMLHLRPGSESGAWGMNITRCHDLYLETLEPDRVYSAWNCTQGRPFQDAQGFGRLQIGADPRPFWFDVEMSREPQAGDDGIDVFVTNQTGVPFRGHLVLDIGRAGTEPARQDQRLEMEAGERKSFKFDRRVGAEESAAKYRLKIVDDQGRMRYLGGTQKIDMTGSDQGPAPPIADAAARRGYQVFRRAETQPVTYRSVPRADELLDRIEIMAAPGQWEAASFCIYPLRGVAGLKLRPTDLRSESGGVIPAANLELRSVSFQSVWKDLRQFESIEHLLRPCDSLDLAAGRTRRIYLIALVPPDARPGLYRGSIEMASATSSSSLPVELRVLPIALAQPKGIGYFMYYPGVESGLFGQESFLKKILADMRDHGMTTLTLYHNCQAEDSDQARIDVDRVVDPKYGVTYARLIELIQQSGLGVQAPLIDISAMHLGREPRLLVDLQRIYHERGWPKVAFYIEDEIDTPERIERARTMLSGLRGLAPESLTATALGLKGAEALGSEYDIWIGCSRADMLAKCLAMGKQPWTYSCRPHNETSPAFVRYFYGQFVWATGLRGVGLWSYAEDGQFFDRFGRTHRYAKDLQFRPEWKQQYGHVVFEGDQIVPTVTWEAVRQGINDYRYLITLERAVASAQQDGSERARKAADQGQRVLDSIRQSVDVGIGADDLKYGRDWRAVGDLAGARHRAAEAIVAIEEARQPAN